MIKIQKDKYPPEVRFVAGQIANRGLLKYKVFLLRLIERFRNSPQEFGDNNTKGAVSFNDDYGEQEYREELINCQGEKCCYCEKPIGGGQLEHYRPKAAYQDSKGSQVCRPGYWWLAYEWKNLLISCGKCNSSGHKGNIFPISGTRATSPQDDLNLEDALLINPSMEDPFNHITFNKEVPAAIDQKGQLNIKTYNLVNRSDLKTPRFEKYVLYKVAKAFIEQNIIPDGYTKDDLDNLKICYRIALKSKQPFSGMLRENIKNGFL